MKVSKVASTPLLKQVIILEIIIFIALASWYAHRVCSAEVAYTEQRLNEEISQIDLTTSNYFSGIESIVGYIGNLSINNAQSITSRYVFELLRSFRQQASDTKYPVITIRWLGVSSESLYIENFHKRFDKEFCYALENDLIDKSIKTPFKMLLGKPVKERKYTINNAEKIPAAFGVVNSNGDYLGSFLMLLDMKKLQHQIAQEIHDHPELSYAIFSKNGEIIAFSGNSLASQNIQKHINNYLTSNNKNTRYISKLASFITSQSYQIRDLMIPHYEYKVIVAINHKFTLSNLSQGFNLTILDLFLLLSICACNFLFAKYKLTNPIMHLSKAAGMITLGKKDVHINSYTIKELDNLANSLRRLITHQHQLVDTNNKLKFALKQIEVVNRAKSEFMRNIQHDLRTPLNHIIGGTELISSQHFGVIQPEYMEYILIINKAGNDLLNTINDIIAATDAENKNIHLYEKNYNLKILATEVIEKMRPQISQANLKLKVHIDKDLPHVYIDAAWFKTIIFSLVDNSIKFSKADGMLGIKLKRTTSGVVISITDNGCGINNIDLKNIRELFSSSSLRNNPGKIHKNIGLGLTIVHNIIDLHDAEFEIKSKVNFGTLIRITIPNIRIKQVIKSSRS